MVLAGMASQIRDWDILQNLACSKKNQKTLYQNTTMLLSYPQCETIFRVKRLWLHLAGQPVHCMICDYIRTARLLTIGDRQDMPNLVPYLPKIRLPVLTVLICAGLMTSLIQNRAF
jgi:hypothetical protein